MQTGPAATAVEFVARRPANSASVILEGTLPAGGRPVVQRLSIHDPPRFLAAALTEALIARGVAVAAPESDGESALSRDYSTANALVTHKSVQLRTLARRLMEVSQNQYAETLIKTMGAQTGTPTFDGGLKAVESVLASWGIAEGDAVLRDGSGLSRYNFVTPRLLVQVLTRLHREPAHSGPFLSALNVAGQGGTLATRLKDTAAAGNARAKDGAMSGVRALCGFVSTRDQETLVFAILINNFSGPGPAATAAIDAIVAKLAEFRR
jgi:D-alanyl-D-alanine carboxypeptidase/D-alanyl-D-alanine-endopeptidase (penicillin-binding protein 4)